MFPIVIDVNGEYQADVSPHPFDPLPRRGIADNKKNLRHIRRGSRQ
ncbi:MAG: hypothetical protein LBP62_02505 [Clostridiales bacterium]|nr:hypothetical protein [Clostridiales bacterium]